MFPVGDRLSSTFSLYPVLVFIPFVIGKDQEWRALFFLVSFSLHSRLVWLLIFFECNLKEYWLIPVWFTSYKLGLFCSNWDIAPVHLLFDNFLIASFFLSHFLVLSYIHDEEPYHNESAPCSLNGQYKLQIRDRQSYGSLKIVLTKFSIVKKVIVKFLFIFIPIPQVWRVLFLGGIDFWDKLI